MQRRFRPASCALAPPSAAAPPGTRPSRARPRAWRPSRRAVRGQFLLRNPAERGVAQETQEPVRIDARALRQKSGRPLALAQLAGLLVPRQARDGGPLLPDLHLMAAHAVVLLNHPPAVLDVLLETVRAVVERLRHVGALVALAAEEERRQSDAPVVLHEGVGHPQVVLRLLLLAAVVDGRVFDLVLEESLVVVPGFAFFRGGG